VAYFLGHHVDIGTIHREINDTER